VQACAEQATPPALVAVSSVAAAGPAPLGQVRSENDPPAPISNYGRSKRSGEIEAEKFADRVPITIIRPGAVFGPRDREMLAIFKTIRQVRCHPLPGLKSPPLSIIHVADAVEILLRAAERGRRIAPPLDGKPGGVGAGYYFACVDEYPTYADFGRMVRKVVGRPHAVILPMPMPLPRLLAGANELRCRLRGRSEAFNLDKIREATAPSWACSPRATFDELDFRPPKPLTERVAETAEWYRQHGWL
jgi:nucleoside-diphosphate-sugar epimerase